jgi:hypothetical protein
LQRLHRFHRTCGEGVQRCIGARRPKATCPIAAINAPNPRQGAPGSPCWPFRPAAGRHGARSSPRLSRQEPPLRYLRFLRVLLFNPIAGRYLARRHHFGRRRRKELDRMIRPPHDNSNTASRPFMTRARSSSLSRPSRRAKRRVEIERTWNASAAARIAPFIRTTHAEFRTRAASPFPPCPPVQSR